jgi:pimeloyl-ACP methyl ester carboxylesterase
MRSKTCAIALFIGLFLLSPLSFVQNCQAIEFQTPQSDPGLLTLSPFFASLLSLSNWLINTANSNGSENLVFTLKDGTRIEGYLFANTSDGPRPLIIADFGLMSSRWSGFGGQLIQDQYETGNVKANFLILDDMTSSAFYTDNGSVGIGGYEAGKILIEVADSLKDKGITYSSLHLLGESLGALAIQQALIEDQRLGNHHFQSAIMISAVVDEIASTGSVFEAFGKDLPQIKGPALSKLGRSFLKAGVTSFNKELETAKSSLPGIDKNAPADFFYDGFAKHLAHRAPASDWNSAVSQETFEAYVETSAALLTQIDQITTPIMLINAKNDPIVAHQQFEEFSRAHEGNPKILTHETGFGSHCGLPATYGTEWTTAVINEALSLN